ncbi:hypothetical protein KAR91_21645 [Candidatus Pacearchaeota archaeon]|nr:hypothetical protein [Candidatus Pacearchaeota archaeon]
MSEFQGILEQLLEDEKLMQPFIATPSSSYRDSLDEKLKEYVRKIENLSTAGSLTNWLKNNANNINSINSKLIDSIDQYLSGSAGKAYDEIEQLMELDIVKNSLVPLKKPLSQYQHNMHQSKSLFRVRESDEHLSERDGIFHIPFDKRNLVKTQRYSIAGLPCLYLGSSLYVCWQEMGKPSLNKLFLSHFKLNDENGEINVLNFAFSLEALRLQNLALFFDNNISEREAKAYLAIWPILLSCSYNAEHPDSSFSIEYVIPNLILQWIGKEKETLSGIMYLSTKTKQLRNNDIGINFVFPPATDMVKHSGFCPKLNNNFKWSKPISWQLLNAINHNGGADENTFNVRLSDDLENQIIQNYRATKFYKMENKLRSFTELKNLENA